jgi:hypothetical protein
MMIGLEEGDEARRPVRLLDLAESDEGMHLVNIPANFLGQLLKPADQGIRPILEDVAIGPKLPQHRVKQREPFWLGMTNHALRDVDEGARNREACARWLRKLLREQVTVGSAHAPHDRLRRNAGLYEIARGITPSVEIIFRRQGDLVRVDHWTLA